MNLSELKSGRAAVVEKINLSDSARDRLNRIGLTVGVKVTMVRGAPFNGPFQIKVRDFYLAMRKADADKISVKEL